MADDVCRRPGGAHRPRRAHRRFARSPGSRSRGCECSFIVSRRTRSACAHCSYEKRVQQGADRGRLAGGAGANRDTGRPPSTIMVRSATEPLCTPASRVNSGPGRNSANRRRSASAAERLSAERLSRQGRRAGINRRRRRRRRQPTASRTSAPSGRPHRHGERPGH